MISFQSITILGLVESLIALRLVSYGFIPCRYDDRWANSLAVAVGILAINYNFMFFYSAIIYPKFFSPLRNVPQSKWHLWRLFQSRFIRQETLGQLLFAIVQETPNNGIVHLGELYTERLLLTGAKLIAELLVHKPYDFEKPENARNFMRHFLGDGLIIIEGDRHRFLRKNTVQAFGYRQVQNLYPRMWMKAMSLVDEIDNIALGREDTGLIEMMTWANKVTMDVIGIAGLGHDFDLLRNSDDPLVKSFNEITGDHMLLYFVMSMWLSFEFVQKLPWSKNTIFKDNPLNMKSICHRLIREKREALRKDPDEPVDILSNLIRTDNFFDNELADQLLTFLVAGHDTTSATLTWAALRDEIQRELATSGLFGCDGSRDFDVARLMENFPILNGVMHETLRLYPTVPVTTRVAACDTSLGEQHIPKGTEVLVSPWLINRSPKLWGGEDCVGQLFSKAEMRCLIAAMVSRFEWTLAMDAKDVIPAGAITIRPQKGLHLKIKRVFGSEIRS
ncbi:cytochrome P450 [Pseudomassariella vexata]|uniref:Cytochrome P450 n=1 Tax=Pseudomassariella vexata TaxID=1141098 RepID=A0A1Y2EI29_9PEZI|nr:cytochrome P450 [Pseudomassariella vexata]ORY70954.1 cytochrome P450 [Pseudomassariella vexata]